MTSARMLTAATVAAVLEALAASLRARAHAAHGAEHALGGWWALVRKVVLDAATDSDGASKQSGWRERDGTGGATLAADRGLSFASSGLDLRCVQSFLAAGVRSAPRSGCSWSPNAFAKLLERVTSRYRHHGSVRAADPPLLVEPLLLALHVQLLEEARRVHGAESWRDSAPCTDPSSTCREQHPYLGACVSTVRVASSGVRL